LFFNKVFHKHIKCLVFILVLMFSIEGCGMNNIKNTDISADKRIEILTLKYNAIMFNMGKEQGEGGKIVLTTAYNALKWGYGQGKWNLVGIEDLWAEALKEGGVLFNRPHEKRWGTTTAEETLDLIGQTTVGPWQLTTTNIKNVYGIPYGVKQNWTVRQTVEYLIANPEIQAKMIADYIQNSYTKYGKRSPYGIQNYFWLEAYVKREIGQGKWSDSVLCKIPTGKTWKDLTPEDKANTGYYAKQLLLGNNHENHGLMFWLWVTGDIDGIKDVFRVWRGQKVMVWDPEKNDAVLTEKQGDYRIKSEDILYCDCHPEFKQKMVMLVEESNITDK